MWTLPQQIRWRTGSWIVAGLGLIALLVMSGSTRHELWTHPGLRYWIATAKAWWLLAAVGGKLLAALGLLAASLTGVPLLLILLPTVLVLGFTWGTLAVVAAEIVAFLTIRRFCRQEGLQPGIPNLDTNKPTDRPIAGWDRAVWPRLFLLVPRRTLDVLACRPHPPRDGVEIAPAPHWLVVAFANALRVALQATWIGALWALSEDYQPFVHVYLWPLIAATVLTAYGISAPYIPELVPGSAAMYRLCHVLTGDPDVSPPASPEATAETPAPTTTETPGQPAAPGRTASAAT